MTGTEFISEFQLLYDAASKGAPDVDNYEISVYLTTAQEELAKAYYSGENKSKAGFENSEKRRRTMNELVANYSQSSQVSSSRGIISESVFYAIPTNVFYIINEQVTFDSKDTCLDGKSVMVKPITHDEFLVDYKNPFRKPNKNKAWRLDISKESSNNVVEIIAHEKLSSYNIRYVKAPKPIIVEDLTTGDFTGLGLSINGETSVSECLLNSEIHREILNRAVELAIRDFRENNLKAKIETNNRV